MCIYLYTGTPGAGKSLHMAELIYYDVKYKRPVVCNFDVNRDVFRDSRTFHYVDNTKLTPQLLVQISEIYREQYGSLKEGQLRLFIDESQILFNARSWNEKRGISGASRSDWIKFFTQHRKLGYDVYLITQYDNMLDKQIRALVEYEFKHRKLNNVGWIGKLVSFLSFGHPVVCAVQFWYPMKQRLRASWMLGRKKFYRIYDTNLIFEGQAF